MPLQAATGQAYASAGRDASIRAVEQALKSLEPGMPVIMVLIFADPKYDLQDAIQGVASVLRNVPVFGFATSAQITDRGKQEGSITVALLAGEDVLVKASYWPDFIVDSGTVAEQMIEGLQFRVPNDNQVLFLAADGCGDSSLLSERLPGGRYTVIGNLVGGLSGHYQLGQVGGQEAGTGGLAAALLAGKIRVGIGTGHGWKPVGLYYKLTRTDGFWIRELDQRPPSAVYASAFSQQPQDWAYPPLSDLIRLYPLGIEQNSYNHLQPRAPMHVEADGSFRMGSPIPAGSVAHLLVGSTTECRTVIRQAARDALEALSGYRPVLALVLADIAWKMLFEGQQVSEIKEVQEILGPLVPVVGGYGIGQLIRCGNAQQLLNQHAMVVLIAEPTD